MDSETEDYEDADEEEAEEEQAPKVRKDPNPPLQSQKKPKRIPEVQATKMPESKYVAYRVQAEEGVMDTETNTIVGKEVYVILAEILNKLSKIEISQS